MRKILQNKAKDDWWVSDDPTGLLTILIKAMVNDPDYISTDIDDLMALEGEGLYLKDTGELGAYRLETDEVPLHAQQILDCWVVFRDATELQERELIYIAGEELADLLHAAVEISF